MNSSTNNIIEELWYGNIDPLNGGIPKSPEMKELIQYIARHREDLEKTLTDEQKEVFEKFDDCNSELNRLSETSIFECGFKLGARLILSVLIE